MLHASSLHIRIENGAKFAFKEVGYFTMIFFRFTR